MKKIYIVNGYPRSGKNAFCEIVYVISRRPVYTFSTVDLVKENAKKMGWNGKKTARDRAFLSSLKAMMTAWNDAPYRDIKSKIEKTESNSIILIMCREPEDIQRYCAELDAKTILVRRESVENLTQSNTSDSQINQIPYDITIHNNSTFDDLILTVKTFLENENLNDEKI